MECDKERIVEAVVALLAGQKKSTGNPQGGANKQLMPEEQRITLTIVQKRFPRIRYQKLQCELPHPYRKCGSAEVCLIIKDLSKVKNFDQDIGVARFKEGLQSAGVTGVTEVFTFTQLRGEYKAFEAKRKLLSRYDVFLADDRIYGRLATVLGNKFFTKNKFPVSVKVSESTTLAAEIQSAIESTYLTIQGNGPQCSMHLASPDQPVEELVANAVEAVAFLKKNFPGGFENIRTLYLKLGSLSLPIYVDTESPNAVPAQNPPKSEGFAAPPQDVTTVEGVALKCAVTGRFMC
ncbi:putative Ribosomal L1 domain-containing protein 1 [Hypsibius exemplaris]|uniref:Ribosomal L1 domain-containing protein 1 n=1 Tax=Hypsibius exemplaris TaxID=2072580 RepID=A0A1W0WID6_HYPEX|nr:putative Ribosomal L1 domain-containing protein 1 [Hypsibius exemplaris]